MDLELTGKRVLVTGASQGIGARVAAAFAAEGARMVLAARSRQALEDLAAALPGDGHRVVALDLCADGAARRLADQGGAVDVIVHCVGGSSGLRELDAASAEWARIWHLNVGHAIDVNNAFIPAMAEKAWGRIVHLSSRVAVELGGAGPYAAAKAYLNAYVGVMGRAMAAKGVLVNGIMPSAVSAPGNNWSKAERDHPDRVARFLENHQSIGRLGTADDLIPFILLLASARNSFAAGSVLSVDGGSK